MPSCFTRPGTSQYMSNSTSVRLLVRKEVEDSESDQVLQLCSGSDVRRSQSSEKFDTVFATVIQHHSTQRCPVALWVLQNEFEIPLLQYTATSKKAFRPTAKQSPKSSSRQHSQRISPRRQKL